MKKLLLLIVLLLFAIPSKGQYQFIKAITNENYNFKLIDGNVAWQYVYEVNKSAKWIHQYFSRARIFHIASSDSASIYGHLDNRPIDYAKYGFQTGYVPMYMIGSPCSYNVNINIKNGKYQVTIFNVVFNPAIGAVMFGSSNLQMTLNEVAYNYRRNKFKPSFVKMDAATILAAVWYDTYLVKSTMKQDDNW